ncbi:MAG: mechanosensitive ion channel family protein [Phaeodactylibacter sp.]|nr:mechanosensitive ion channel family protein [Phaeodactylibacter sp.]MCB9301259.1 mechanosensitive ion channel family protein [Lewinellaceae bacterium]
MDTIWNQFQQSFNSLLDKLAGWIDGVVLLLPNILLAAIVMGLSLLAARYVKKYLSKGLSKFSTHVTVNRFLANIGTAVFVMVMLFVVLGILQLDTALKSMLAGAGVVGLAIGLALQDPILNLFSGIMMSTRQFFEINDVVETNGYTGTIEKISLRSTVLKTFQGQEVVLPNKMVYQNPLTNYTSSGERRVDISCGVSYGDDLDKVEKAAIDAIRQRVEFDEDKPLELFYTEFGSSSINFVLRFWLDQKRQPNIMKAQSDAIKAIKQEFDQKGISIPFPIQTLDFGVKGGESLKDALPKELLRPSSRNGDDN